MRKLKKIDFTKIIVKGTEWFSSLALLNLCWLLFSLPILTIIPATDAVFEVLHEWETIGKKQSVFHSFKKAFRGNFKTSFKLGIPLLIILGIITLDIYILNQLAIPSLWFQVLKYAFYTLSGLILISIFYGYPLMKHIDKNHVRVFLMGLFLAIGDPLITLGGIGSLLILVLAFLLWPAMMFFFIVSGFAYVMTKAVAHVLNKREEDGF